MLAQSSKGHGVTGEAIFQEQCIGCHGPDGRAQTELGKKLGAADLTSDAIRQQSDSQRKHLRTKKEKCRPLTKK
jgi:mono/diheme cytochrome c family protein